MHCLPFWVYKLTGASRRRRYYYTPNPRLDASYWQEQGGGQVQVLTPPLSIAQAEALCQALLANIDRPRQESRLIQELWAQIGQQQVPPLEAVQPLAGWTGANEAKELHKVLSGRILLLAEVEQAVAERRLIFSYPLADLLQYLHLDQKLECRAALTEEPRRSCLRCGQVDLQPSSCLECGAPHVWVCSACGNMGQAKSCVPLYACPTIGSAQPRSVNCQLPAPLTAPQVLAAQSLQQFVRQTQHKTCLFWAVCGAGKTEVAMPAVQQVLAAGGRVLWATPRRDVVTELAPRLTAAFPDISLAALHGQAAVRFSDDPLVIATTHQAIRFFSAFDLVILDEVDAFPYSANPMLELAVQRALRPDGKLIYLTATPTPQLRQQVRRGQAQQVTLPLRWHGHPLPVPVSKRVRLPRPGQAAWPIPPLLSEIITASLEEDSCQLLIYVPSVRLAEQVGQALKVHFGSQQAEYIHARDPQRDVKRARFFAGEFPILVTTTSLERAVTIPRVNIVVLYADHATIFSTPVLMQIAGRAGRAAAYPTGKVYYLAERPSREMRQAIKQIQQLNLAARQVAVAAAKEASKHVES